jgi:hypothetical protein
LGSGFQTTLLGATGIEISRVGVSGTYRPGDQTDYIDIFLFLGVLEPRQFRDGLLEEMIRFREEGKVLRDSERSTE